MKHRLCIAYSSHEQPRFFCDSLKFFSCGLYLSCQIPCGLPYFSSENSHFFFASCWGLEGFFVGWFICLFSFPCMLYVYLQDTQIIKDSRKLSLLSKWGYIPGSIQVVSGRCLPLALGQVAWTYVLCTRFQTGVFPSLGVFWVFCGIACYFSFQKPQASCRADREISSTAA